MGGYDANGIDSAYFSQGLCVRMAAAAQAAAATANSIDVNPRALMAAGYLQILIEGRVRGGASTACVGVYKPDGTFSAAKYHSPPLP